MSPTNAAGDRDGTRLVAIVPAAAGTSSRTAAIATGISRSLVAGAGESCASLSSVATGSGPSERRAEADRAGSPDNADQLLAGSVAVPAQAIAQT